MIEERTGIITFQGNPRPSSAKAFPWAKRPRKFCVLANDLTPRTLADYKGKVLVISVVPSLDTPVATCRPAVSTPKPPSFPTTSAS